MAMDSHIIMFLIVSIFGELVVISVYYFFGGVHWDKFIIILEYKSMKNILIEIEAEKVSHFKKSKNI